MEKSINMWQNYKMDIQNNLIPDINNFCLASYFKRNQSGFKTQKNHKSTGVFFKQNDEHNIDNDAINNNNDNIFQNNMNKTIIILSWEIILA